MSTQMSVFLSQDSAAPHWGEKALLSFSETGATIHLGEVMILVQFSVQLVS